MHKITHVMSTQNIKKLECLRSRKSSEAIHLIYVIILTIQLYTFLFLLVTGNANFWMNQTTFTLLGFTQPQTALPSI